MCETLQGGGGQKICRENTVALRIATVTKSKYIQELLFLDIVEEEFLCTTFVYSLSFLALLPSLAY